MKFLAGIAALAAVAAAAPGKAPTPLDVTLEKSGNSQIKATITNTGSSGLKLLKTGTFLDEAATDKVKVQKDGSEVNFQGLRLHLATDRLDDANFQRIAAGETYEVLFDAAEIHDLSQGGKFSFTADGAISYAEEEGTELVGSLPYVSNTLESDVDGSEAASALENFHAKAKRTDVQSSCNNRPVIYDAINNCASIARNAASAASSGSAAKLNEYFKGSSSSIRNTVSGVFNRMASECSSTTGGQSVTYCEDIYNSCNGNVLAYTLPSYGYIAYCDLAFNYLPLTPSQCHQQTLQGTVTHESTHLTSVKGTQDYGGYGYNFIQSLSQAQNLNHADTYCLYAQAVYYGC